MSKSNTSNNAIVYTEEWNDLVKNVSGGNAPLFMGDGDQLKAAAAGFAGAFITPLLSEYSDALDMTDGSYAAADGNSQPYRIYKPRQDTCPDALIVFFHGGGELQPLRHTRE